MIAYVRDEILGTLCTDIGESFWAKPQLHNYRDYPSHPPQFFRPSLFNGTGMLNSFSAHINVQVRSLLHVFKVK